MVVGGGVASWSSSMEVMGHTPLSAVAVELPAIGTGLKGSPRGNLASAPLIGWYGVETLHVMLTYVSYLKTNRFTSVGAVYTSITTRI